MLPKNSGDIALASQVEFADYPTLTYIVDPATKQVRGLGDGAEALAQAVEIILSVERYKFQILTPNDGAEFARLVGSDVGFVASELKRRVADAFVPDRRIIGVSGFVFSQDSADSLTVNFVVNTVFGDIPAKKGVALR